MAGGAGSLTPGDRSVSVVIPTYNRASYVRRAVESALAQAPFGGRLEVVVVDDGSTDDTPATLSSFGDRIVSLRTPHSGVPAAARNAGLAAATGRYVAFLDSDDLWLLDKLRRQLATLGRHPDAVLAYGNCEYMDADGARTGKLVWRPEDTAQGDVFAPLLRRNFVTPSTVVVPRALVLEVGGFDESRELVAREDYELWLRLAARGPFQFDGSVLALFRVHEGNLDRMPDAEHLRRTVAAYRSVLRASDVSRRPQVLARLAEVNLALATERGTWRPRAWAPWIRGAWFRARALAARTATRRGRQARQYDRRP